MLRKPRAPRHPKFSHAVLDKIKERAEAILNDDVIEQGEDIISAKRLSELFGVCRATLRHWVRCGYIKGYQVGNRKMYFRKSDFKLDELAAKPFMTTKDVAAKFNVTPTTVIRWISSGQLVARKVGYFRWLISHEDVQDFLESGFWKNG